MQRFRVSGDRDVGSRERVGEKCLGGRAKGGLKGFTFRKRDDDFRVSGLKVGLRIMELRIQSFGRAQIHDGSGFGQRGVVAGFSCLLGSRFC